MDLIGRLYKVYICHNSEIQNNKVIENYLDLFETFYMRVFGVADDESEVKISKIKMTDSKWRMKLTKTIWICLKLCIWGFLSRWWRILTHNFEIQNGGFSITDDSIKNYLDLFKTLYMGGFESLMTNLNSEFQNSKWRI